MTHMKLPIIYRDEYNISFMGFQKLHPFDTEKYGRIYRYLIDHAGLSRNSFTKPDIVSEEDLLKVHPQTYFDSLEKSKNVARIAEVKILAFGPNFLLQKYFLTPLKYSTGGTILGAELSLSEGWAINLSGGFHHAKRHDGDGFSFYADIPLAIFKLWEKNSALKVLVIDLDAHQGNGIADYFKDDKRVSIMDVYNEEIWPEDEEAKKYIDFNIPVRSSTGDDDYLNILNEHVPIAIKKTDPDLIIYNAGTDILAGDTLGLLNLSDEGIIKRDEIIFTQALKTNVSILHVLSGGYTKRSGLVIGKSIKNLLKKILV